MSVLYTFYSYKGGVGRSMALANVAALLSSWGHSVLAIDWDLEAPGLEKYFTKNPSRLVGSRRDKQGVVDIVTAFAEGRPLDWQKCLIKAYPFGTKMSVDILGAGQNTREYSERLHKINWEHLFDELEFGAYLEEMRDEWLNKYDFVLVDSRTGITDIGGVCTIHLPDTLVLLFTANEQSLEGVVDVMERAQAGYDELPEEYQRRDKLKAVPVPSRFERLTEKGKADEWLKKFADGLSGIYADWLPEGVPTEAVLEKLYIPNIPFWSFGELLPVVLEGTSDPRGIGYSYALLARLLKNDLEWNTTLEEMGASGERSPNVINREADDALAALGDDARESARRVLVSLVQVAPPRRGEDALRHVPLSEFDEPSRRVIKSLVGARLLSSSRDESSGEEVVAFAQEATLRHWEKLKSWLGKNREFLVWRQQLRASMNIWEDNGKQPGDLLTGAALSTAEEFHATHADELSESDKKYIAASTAAVKRLRRVRRAIMAAVVVTVVLLVYLGVQAYRTWQASVKQQQEAERQAQQAHALLQAKDETERGNNLSTIKNFDGAIDAYTRAIGAKSDYAPAYLKRGIAYMNLGNNYSARADFNKVVQLSDRESQESYDARAYIEQLDANIVPIGDLTPTPTPTVTPMPGITPTPTPVGTNLPRRVYIQIQKGMPEAKAREVADSLTKVGFVVVRVQTVSAVPQDTEVRYYRDDDSAGADQIRDLLKGLGVSDAQPRYVIGYENSTAVRPKHYEIWFSTNSLTPERDLK
jgi:MinD-like ATPase involved in chromosome partitioning or flagellar assembly